MKADCIIRNGIVVTPHGIVIGGVAVRGTKIVSVASDELLPECSSIH